MQHNKAHRCARYQCYRAFYSYRMAGYTLIQRARYPDCVELLIQKKFPDLRCGDACDFLRGCERAKHYTGFLSKEESRERRDAGEGLAGESLWKDAY